MMRPSYKDSIYNVPRYKGAYLIYYFALLLNKIKIFIQAYMTCLSTLAFPLLLPLMCALPTIDQFIPSFIVMCMISCTYVNSIHHKELSNLN